ncbi:MAG: hypothetical protein WCB10_12030 [Steroidobacteraceae bacterium]
MSTPGEALDVLQLRAELAQLRNELHGFKTAHTELVKVLRELIEALDRPKTRESTINLPSGPVHMTVKEH